MIISFLMMLLQVARVIRNSILTHWLLRLTIVQQEVLWIHKNTFNKVSLLFKLMKITIFRSVNNNCRILFIIHRWEFNINWWAIWNRFHSSKNNSIQSWLRARMKILLSKSTIAASLQQIRVWTVKMFSWPVQTIFPYLLFQTKRSKLAQMITATMRLIILMEEIVRFKTLIHSLRNNFCLWSKTNFCRFYKENHRS